MLHPLAKENPGKEFIAANRAASCRYMKMITLPKLRDALRDLKPVVRGRSRARRASASADRPHGRDRLDPRRAGLESTRLEGCGLAGAGVVRLFRLRYVRRIVQVRLVAAAAAAARRRRRPGPSCPRRGPPRSRARGHPFRLRGRCGRRSPRPRRRHLGRCGPRRRDHCGHHRRGRSRPSSPSPSSPSPRPERSSPAAPLARRRRRRARSYRRCRGVAARSAWSPEGVGTAEVLWVSRGAGLGRMGWLRAHGRRRAGASPTVVGRDGDSTHDGAGHERGRAHLGHQRAAAGGADAHHLGHASGHGLGGIASWRAA